MSCGVLCELGESRALWLTGMKGKGELTTFHGQRRVGTETVIPGLLPPCTAGAK